MNQVLLRLLSTHILVRYRLELNLSIRETKILYRWFGGFLLDLFRLCETHFTAYQWFMANRSAISPFLGFWFLIYYDITQSTLPLHQECIQVVRSNRVAWKRSTESNSTPAMDPGHMNVVLKWCTCMNWCMCIFAMDSG